MCVTCKPSALSISTVFIVLLATSAARALPYQFPQGGAWNFLQNVSTNDVGISPGATILVGVQCAVPLGESCADPNVDYGGTAARAVQGPIVAPLSRFNTTLFPNIWTAEASPGPTGAWTLEFANGPDVTAIQSPDLVGASVFDFVKDVTISGTGATPTLDWALPAGVLPDGARVNIFDLEKPVGVLKDIIHVENVPGGATSYSVPSTLSSGKTLKPHNRYSFELSIFDTRSNTGGLGNENILSRSRSFFDFMILPPGSPPLVYLPIGGGGLSGYDFDIGVGGPDQTVFIDPLVAIGYDFEIGLGDPNFLSVLLPEVGDDLFELWLFDETLGDYVFADSLAAGQEFVFAAGGVDRFRILGIEPEAGLDPNNPIAFITGLTFAQPGRFTGSMTPLVASVPEPGGLGLLVFALVSTALLTWQRHWRQARRIRGIG